MNFCGKSCLKGSICLVRDALCVDGNGIAIDSATAFVGQFFCTDGGILSSVDKIRVFNPVGMYGEISVTVERACGLEVAVHIKGDGMRGGKLSREIDTETFFCTDHRDTVRIHPANVREINGVLRGSGCCF